MPSIQSPSKLSLEGGEHPVHRLRNVVKLRTAGGTTFKLVVPELSIRRGDRIALVGVSGSGKSTLLDMLAMTLQPSAVGEFAFCPPNGSPTDVWSLWGSRRIDRLAELRKRHVGYVLQTGGLLSYLSVRDNIALSRRLLRLPEDGTTDRLARELGIAEHLHKLPRQLSVGERQRVAVARALAHRPEIVLADEPTASVDPAAAETIMRLFLSIADALGVTTVVASHDWNWLRHMGLRRLEHKLERDREGGLCISSFWG